MRLSKEQTARNRSRILETAIRLFRERGIEGVGIADLMRASGFTHGGFYNHFRSKDALVSEAARASLGRAEAALAEALQSGTAEAWEKYVASYLSQALPAEPNDDATFAAFAAELARQRAPLQRIFARTVENMTGALAKYLSRARAVAVGGGTMRAVALHRLSALVGSWILAQAVARANPELAREIVRANRRWLNATELRTSPRGASSRSRRRGPRRRAARRMSRNTS